MSGSPDDRRGAWRAVLANGVHVIENPGQVTPNDIVSISIRRGDALPVATGGGERLPNSDYSPRNLISPWYSMYAEDAATPWAQAQAMAAGLNAADGAGFILTADETQTAASFLNAYLRLAGRRVDDNHPVRKLAASLDRAAVR